MLDPNIVAEVCRLLAEGKESQRAIARRIGICRGSVAAIASGQWAERREKRGPCSEPCEPSGPPSRCPGCGGFVYMPCVLCETQRALAHRERVRRFHGPAPHRTPKYEDPRDDGGMRLDLRPEHRARYEEIVAQRKQLGAVAV